MTRTRPPMALGGKLLNFARTHPLVPCGRVIFPQCSGIWFLECSYSWQCRCMRHAFRHKSEQMVRQRHSQALEYWCAHTGFLDHLCMPRLRHGRKVYHYQLLYLCVLQESLDLFCWLRTFANTFYLLYYRSDLGDRLAYFPFIITRLPCKLDLCVSRFACVPSLLLPWSVSKGSVVAVRLRYMCGAVL